MAKLSEKQKEINAARRKIKSKAYHARKKAFYQAIDAAEREIKGGVLGERVRLTDGARDALYAERQAKESALIKQIAELQAQLAALRNDYPGMQEAKLARNMAHTEMQSALMAARAKVEAEFSDIYINCVGVVSGYGGVVAESVWVPPTDVAAEMNAVGPESAE